MYYCNIIVLFIFTKLEKREMLLKKKNWDRINNVSSIYFNCIVEEFLFSRLEKFQIFNQMFEFNKFSIVKN